MSLTIILSNRASYIHAGPNSSAFDYIFKRQRHLLSCSSPPTAQTPSIHIHFPTPTLQHQRSVMTSPLIEPTSHAAAVLTQPVSTPMPPAPTLMQLALTLNSVIDLNGEPSEDNISTTSPAITSKHEKLLFPQLSSIVCG